MRFTLQQMVKAAMRGSQADAMQKIAEEANDSGACEACGESAPPGSKLCRECAAKAAKAEAVRGGDSEEEGEEKTSALRVEKLASAVEEVLYNFDNMDWSLWHQFKLAASVPTASPGTGPGAGPTATPTTDKTPTPGVQATEFGEAKKDKPPMNPPMETPVGGGKGAPNAMADNVDDLRAAYPEQGVMKQGGMRSLYQNIMLRKVGADSESPASVSGPKFTTLPEDQPSQMKRPPEVTSQEAMVASNQAAIDATKRQAAEVPKRRMGEVIEEPAQSAASDKALDANLGSATVDQAGAKIAAARVLLQKVASQGCSCGADHPSNGSCNFCKLAARIEQRKGARMGKASQMAGAAPMPTPPTAPGSSAGAAPPPPVPGSPMPGTGM